jgi:putative ABC transport system permease protein
MEELLGLETAPRRTQTAVLALFACAAMLLAGLGLHGLLSFGVSQRRQEIGVRVALGATGARVVRLVVGEGLVLSVAGGVAGLGLAYAAARWFESLLAGVQPSDPPIYLAAAVLTAVVTLSGSLVPALRALRVDPVTAIRAE